MAREESKSPSSRPEPAEQDTKCDSDSECVPRSQCDSYLNESEQLKSLRKGSSEYYLLLGKLTALVCNRKQRKICCTTNSGGSQTVSGKIGLGSDVSG